MPFRLQGHCIVYVFNYCVFILRTLIVSHTEEESNPKHCRNHLH